MAVQLPDFTALGDRPTPRPAGGVAAYQPQSNQLGEEISRAGSDVSQAAELIQHTNTYQNNIAAEAGINKLRQFAVDREFNSTDGFRMAKEGAAVGDQFTKNYTDQFTDASQAISDSLQNEQQKQFFAQRSQVAALQFRSALLSHQAQETQAFGERTANDTVELSLRSMAQRPLDELNFQTEMSRIEGVIDHNSARKGLPPEAISLLKGKMMDQAYGTRILSVLNGVPGVVDANPYLAEKMFEQVQGKLGPASQVQLAEQVQRGVKTVQQRDIAQAAINGVPLVDPNQIRAVTDGTKPLEGVIKDLESRGQRYDSNGNLLTSHKGAQGEMQVMPATAANPGYGVQPAKDNSPDELARVGRDVVGAMTARYQDPSLILAAYNAGPGNVDKWIAKYGDPRTGAISGADWAQQIPFSETRKYVTNGLAKLNQGGAPVATVTKRELKTQLPAIAAQARDTWNSLYPNDPQGADAVEARVYSYGNRVLNDVAAQQGAALDTVDRVLNAVTVSGRTPTLDDVLNDPAGRQAWGQMSPPAQTIKLRSLASGEYIRSDPKLVSDLRQRLYLPDGDPNKITQPWQVTQYAGTRLNYTDTEHLFKEMAQANNPFLHLVNDAKTRALKSLTASMYVISPDAPSSLTPDAAARFNADLDNKIKDARAKGIDPQTLLTPGNPNYALTPEKIAGFMPTEAQMVAESLRQTKLRSMYLSSNKKAQEIIRSGGDAAPAPAPVQQRLPGETPAQYLQRIGMS